MQALGFITLDAEGNLIKGFLMNEFTPGNKRKITKVSFSDEAVCFTEDTGSGDSRDYFLYKDKHSLHDWTGQRTGTDDNMSPCTCTILEVSEYVEMPEFAHLEVSPPLWRGFLLVIKY